MILLKRNRKKHWEHVYKKTSPTEVGWFQAYPEMSLKLINATGVNVDESIIDVGGGVSKLSKLLLEQGYRNITVLDISGESIEKAKTQLGDKSEIISWIEADITKFSFSEIYDVWHDRAVFHFLTDAVDRKNYINSLNNALEKNGHLIVSTFGLNAPPRCSGLAVVRYNPETLHNEMGDNFELIESLDEVHVTPSGVRQEFIFCRFIKRA